MRGRLRTLGREHFVLNILSDGEEHQFKEFLPAMAMSSAALARLLMKGLIQRNTTQMRVAGIRYSITDLGMEVYKRLEEIQPWSELTAEMRRATFRQADGTIIKLAGECDVAQTGYKWAIVEVDPQPYWIEWFKTHKW